jgi:hypothetical protein
VAFKRENIPTIYLTQGHRCDNIMDLLIIENGIIRITEKHLETV